MPYAAPDVERPLPTASELAASFESLARFPERLATLAARLDAARALHRPSPDAFSFHEHVWHLRDIEVLGYARRLRAVAADDAPFLADLDGTALAVSGRYHERDLALGLAEFANARAANVEFARGLPRTALARRGELEGVGCVRLADLLELWRNHDAGHAAELAELAQGFGLD